MCKIMVFTNASKLDVKRASEVIGNILLKTERDGFGYAVQGPDGVFGEKCVANTFNSRIGVGGQILKKDPRIPIRPRYESFGKLGKVATGPAMFHGRVSTNEPGLLNTHPMQLSESYVKTQLGAPTDPTGLDIWHLIHNGVVRDHGKPYEKLTDNDSEDLLFRFMQGIGEVEKHLTGYYAFASIDPAGRLHIAKDYIADLYVAWSKDLESFVYGTTEGLIHQVAKKLKFKHGPIEQVQDESYIIFQGNDPVHVQEIVSRGPTPQEARHSQLSIGRAIDVPSSSTNPRGPSQTSFDDNAVSIKDDTSRFNDGGGDDWQAKYEGRSSRAEADRDQAYAEYIAELELMDESYEIYDDQNRPITLREFKQLDSINRELCTVIRPDGTLVDPEGDLPQTSSRYA